MSAGAAFVAAGIQGTFAALGAAVAENHPAVGAAVGSAALGVVGLGLLWLGGDGTSWTAREKAISALVIGGNAAGAAVGAALADQHPAVGAFIGSVSTFALEVAVSRALTETPKQVGASGAPLHLRAVGGFP